MSKVTIEIKCNRWGLFTEGFFGKWKKQLL